MKNFITGFIVATLLFAVLLWPAGLFAQGPTGFTKIASPSTTTFVDSQVVDGSAYQYAVTAFNAAGEGAASNIVTASIPLSGTHSVALTWTPPTSGGTPSGYNVYRFLVQVPGPVTGLGAVVN